MVDAVHDGSPVPQQSGSQPSKTWIPLSQHRGPFSPGEHSSRWQLRQHRQELVDAGAVVLIGGRMLVNPEAFDSVLQKIGQAAARARQLRDNTSA